MPYIFIILIIFVLIVVIRSICIVPQAHVYVIERLGTFRTELGTGPHMLLPVFDRVAKKVSLKERVVDFKPQQVITKDNVTMQIDTVVFFQVTDAKRYTYGSENPMMAIENFTATTLRNIIGELELDSTLTSRDTINTKITSILDEETDRWGIKVIRVELKNILPPREIQESMEKQMKAERERREKILQAEGEKKSQVLVSESEKEAMILRADAAREKKILEAKGEAQAIALVQQAIADSLKELNQANPNEAVLQLKALEAFAKAADGKATKIIIPSEIQGIAGLANGIKSAMVSDE